MLMVVVARLKLDVGSVWSLSVVDMLHYRR